MGILDELRDETERKKIVDHNQTISNDNIASIYKNEILPKMQDIFHFFKEIVNHLQYLQNPIEVIDYSEKYPMLGQLVQRNYKLSTDKHGGMVHFDKLKEIHLRYFYVGEGIMDYTVKNQADVEQQIQFLTAKKVPFEWSRQHNSIEKSSAIFQIERKIPVKINFTVDYDNSLINLDILNHHNFSYIKKSYKASEITEVFLDQLVKFLLRKKNNFIKEEMNEQEREILRGNLRESIKSSDSIIQDYDVKNKSLLNKVGSFFKN